MQDCAIAVSGLSHSFGEGRARRPVLCNVDLVAEPGEIVFLTGRSGSGKTTLLTLLGGLRRIQLGRIVALGQDLAMLDRRGLEAFRRSVRFVFQQHFLLASLSALRNVELGLGAFDVSRAETRRRSIELLDAVGLAERLDARRTELSGGEQQRVAIARALVSRPAMLLADEPTAFLDSESSVGAVALIRRLASELGCTVVIATHDDRIMHLADRRYVLADGIARHVPRPPPPHAAAYAQAADGLP